MTRKLATPGRASAARSSSPPDGREQLDAAVGPTQPAGGVVASAATPGEIRLTVPGNPVPKARPRFDTRTSRVYTPDSTTAAEKRIVEYLKASYPFLRPVGGRFGVLLRFYLSGVGRGDWDNYGKLVCDALNGRVWCDDKQVRSAMVELYDNCKQPRTEITIWPLPALGRNG